MSEKEPTIYEQMSKQRLEIAAAQISILTYYDFRGKDKRVQELYDVSHKSIIDEQSEKSIEEMDELIGKYLNEINAYRTNNPQIERSEEVKSKFKRLEGLCRSYGL